MRLIQVLVPAGKRDAILDVLDDEGIDYALTDETSGREYTAVVTFPVPTAAVEPVLDRLRDAGVEREAYTVVVNAETVVSRQFEALEERYEADEGNGERIAREELVTRVEDLAPRWTPFLVMTAVSAVVATSGLLLDSPAVVVGSMVIAPLIGPALATSVGTVVDERSLFVRGVRLQVVGGAFAIASAALFAYLARTTHTVPLSASEVFAIGQIRERLAPDFLSLAVALGAGVAGALSLSSGVSTALVGVMIAVALVPPTAVVGIGIAWNEPLRVSGAFVLVLVNFLSINFAALAVLWYQGYRPERWFRLEEARLSTLKRIAAMGLGILVLSAFLGGVTYTTFQSAQFEDDARGAVTDLLATYEDLRLLDLTVQYDAIPVKEPSSVVVEVGYDRGTDPPALADLIAARIRAVASPTTPLTDTPTIEVQVRYVATETRST